MAERRRQGQAENFLSELSTFHLEKEITHTGFRIVRGTGVSTGIAIGKASLVRAIVYRRSGGEPLDDLQMNEAIAAFDRAVITAVGEVEGLQQRPGRPLNEAELAIVDTQVDFLTDPQLRENVLEKITTQNKTAVDAVLDATEELVEQFRQLDDEYLRARAADIADIGQRIARHLGATGEARTKTVLPGSILVAEDISPSDAIALDLSAIAGFVTRVGGKTSHTALLARARHIPAIVGCGTALDEIRDGDMLILNGATGELLLNPDPATIADYTRQQAEEERLLANRRIRTKKAAQTTDGTEIQLMLNIAGPGDLHHAETNHSDGVGLYRTEMLFMQGTAFPTEAEQLAQYRNVMELAGTRPVIFRSIDIGGDKPLPYYPFPPEQNPFLGYRAIRFSLDRKDIFITQLRAILRAAAGREAGIMFPMISSLAECRAAKSVLEEAKTQLAGEGLAFNPTVRVGIMIEIPAAALIADILAAEVDFFSIGTNDLCQYSLAVDRMNEKISDLYNPFHPGLLRLIRQIVDAGHQRGITVGMCGEMAGDPLATKLLLGMGLREFSMSAPSVPEIHDAVCSGSLEEARQLAEAVLRMGDSAEIIEYLKPNRT